MEYKNKSIQHTDTKRYFKSRIGKLYLLQYFNMFLIFLLFIFCIHHFTLVEKRVGQSYYNITRQNEELHNATIDANTGKIIRTK